VSSKASLGSVLSAFCNMVDDAQGRVLVFASSVPTQGFGKILKQDPKLT